VGGGVQLGPLGTAVTDWPTVPDPGDYDDGEFDGMKIVRGNRSTRRKPTPAPLCPPVIPLDETRNRTRAAAVVASDEPLELWRGLDIMPYGLNLGLEGTNGHKLQNNLGRIVLP
jgi:hypothetical protein